MKGQTMWLDNLKELKEKTGKSAKQIAEETKLPERTVIRIFSGDTDHPYVDTLHRIVTVLGGSLDSIFADTKVVVGDSDLVTMQTEVDRLSGELTLMAAENARLSDEVVRLNDEVCTLTTENDKLRIRLEYEERISALHNYYMKQKANE